MSKTTKALAILGVVAGLGVAALPLDAMAEVTELKDEAQVTDQVTVKTTVKDYISIELRGVDNEGEFDQGEDVPSDIKEGEGENEKVVAHAHVLDLGDLISGGDPVTGSLLVNVKTNSAKGFRLGISAAGTTLSGTGTTPPTIPAGAPDNGTSAWGYKVSSTNATVESGFDTTWQSITTSNVKIATYPTATPANTTNTTENDGVDTKVTFGVSADSNQAPDEYKQTVTFTAATDAIANF